MLFQSTCRLHRELEMDDAVPSDLLPYVYSYLVLNNFQLAAKSLKKESKEVGKSSGHGWATKNNYGGVTIACSFRHYSQWRNLSRAQACL